MSDIEQLQQQVINQDREILRLRAELAEARTRVANLQRMYDNSQNHIGRLQAALKRHRQSLAEQVFEGRQ